MNTTLVIVTLVQTASYLLFWAFCVLNAVNIVLCWIKVRCDEYVKRHENSNDKVHRH